MKTVFALLIVFGASLAEAVTVHRSFRNGYPSGVQGKELFELAPEPKTFVPVEGADHNDLIGVLGLYEYKKLLLKMANNEKVK